MKDHWENDEKMMRENTREPVVSFLILPGVFGRSHVAKKPARMSPNLPEWYLNYWVNVSFSRMY
jgi:hypothetical protein